MAVETWIDEIAELAGTIDNGRGGRVRSYYVFKKREFPEALNTFPCALTYTAELRANYSLGGPNTDLWYGVTEFHLFDSVAKSNYPEIMRYFARIKAAFALHMTLGGTVAYVQLRTDEPGLQGPVTLQYGEENPHLGIVAQWVVKESTTGQFTVGV